MAAYSGRTEGASSSEPRAKPWDGRVAAPETSPAIYRRETVNENVSSRSDG